MGAKKAAAPSCGRRNWTPAEKNQLNAQCGGYCQKPDCNASLFKLLADEKWVNVGELAHIIAHGDEGPRADKAVPGAEREDIANIIVLCPTCHTIVDKAPGLFPVGVLLEWKRDHVARIEAVFQTPRFDSRADLAAAVQDILRPNRLIHKTYGPRKVKTPFEGAADAKLWRRYVLTDIIPNNARALDYLDANSSLLKHGEKDVVEKFRLHAKSLELRHFSGDGGDTALLFPTELNTVLEDLLNG